MKLRIKNTAFFPAILAIVILFTAVTSSAQIADYNPAELQEIDVIEHPGETIPLDLVFTNEYGDTVRLSEYFNRGKPVILTLAYYECPMLCTLVLNGMTDGVRDLGWFPGDKFQMITVSIDPKESSELAAGKKKTYLDNLSMPINEDGWAFLVGEESQSKMLADAIGFEYYYDEKNKQYAHPAAAFVITEDGRISRYLYGIEFKSRDLKLALMEASRGKIGSTIDRIILYCFHYDPKAGGYVIFAANVMKLGGGFTLLSLVIFLSALWVMERRKKSVATLAEQKETVKI
ncbi:MAG: SCO family protein [candidate division Zixibacteria bacterium]